MSVFQAVLLAQAMTLTVSDRVELRARGNDGEEQVDAETRPAVVLGGSRDDVSWSLAYTPVLTALAVGQPASEITLYHTLTASTTMRSRRSTFTVAQSLDYGTRDFSLVRPVGDGGSESPEPTEGPDIPEPIDAPQNQTQIVDQTLRFGATTTSFTLAHTLSRRLFEVTAVGYTASGGLDENARELYPLLRSPWLTQSLGYRASRADTLTTTADARMVWTGSDRRVDLLLVDERWSRRYGKYFATDLSGGAVLTRQETAGEDTEFGAYPNATAAAHYGGQSIDATVSAALTAVADRMSGAVDQRTLWTARVGWPVGDLAFNVGAAGGRSLDMESEGALSTFSTSAGVAYRANRFVAADVGATHTLNSYVGQDTTVLWTAYAGLTLNAEPLTF
jgi:hypothetical protein